MNNNITFCNNPRCHIDCKRKIKVNYLGYISIACFGPINGDNVDAPSDCNMFMEIK